MKKKINTFLIFCKKYNLVTLIMACFSYSFLCLTHIIQAYNPYSWIIFGLLCIVFYKSNIYDKKYRKEIITFSSIFSILLVFGEIVYNLQYNRVDSVFRSLFSIKSFIKLIGSFNLLYILFLNIYPVIYNFKLKSKGNFKSNKKLFIISFIIMLFCWLPYFLRFYPGILTSDSMWEIYTISDNFVSVSDHHPVIHLLFMALPFNIGTKIFNSAAVGVALAALSQMVVMSAIFSYFIVFLNKRKVNKFILYLTLLFYAILPMHAFYSITLWKDIVFAGMLLLLSLECLKLVEQRNNLSYKNMISFVIISILCIFFRNNGVYMYFVLAIISLIIFKKYRKLFLISFVIVFGTYYTVKGPIFKMLDVKSTESAEYIGMPLQQIGRMAYKNVEFSEYEKKELDKLIPIDIMANVYNPQVSDGIKFDKNYNGKVFDENKGKYLKIWLGLVLKHPSIALEAYANSTLGYWYPGVNYWAVARGIFENRLDINTNSKLPKCFNIFFDKVDSRNFPIANMQWSIGLCFWIIALFGFITYKKKGYRYLYIFVPVFGIWLTMMAASPVFGEFRYVYGAFTTLPLLLLMPYLKDLKN